MCPSSCLTAPIAIRPALYMSGSTTTDEPRSIAAQPQAPRPAGSCEHSGNCGHLHPGTGAGVRAGLAWGQLQLPRSHRRVHAMPSYQAQSSWPARQRLQGTAPGAPPPQANEPPPCSSWLRLSGWLWVWRCCSASSCVAESTCAAGIQQQEQCGLPRTRPLPPHHAVGGGCVVKCEFS